MATINFPHILLVLLLAIGTSLSSAWCATEKVRFKSSSLQLVGNLYLPKGKGAFPAVVMLHGSGPSTRKESKKRAKQLVRQGVAVLCYDKRGVGQSEGKPDAWRYFNFNDLADDAVAAIQFLKSHPRINKSKLGLVAASQSGWVAPLAAAKCKDIRFMIIISASVCTVAEDRLFERATRLEREGFTADELLEVKTMQLADHELCRAPDTYPQFQRLWKQNENKRWFPRVYGNTAILPANAPYRKWYRSVLDFSPIKDLKASSIPMLWLFGDPEIDRFGPVEQSMKQLKALQSAGKRYQIHVYKGADHNLNGADYRQDISAWLAQTVFH